jgi:hexosaminidase
MSPENHGCYLDHKHLDKPEEPGRLGIATIKEAFFLDPVTEEMDDSSASLVLGGQGNLWSEVIYAGKIAEYMTFPRICAIAEALWSQRKSKDNAESDLENFSKRLAIHQCRLDKLGLLQYRGPLG